MGFFNTVAENFPKRRNSVTNLCYSLHKNIGVTFMKLGTKFMFLCESVDHDQNGKMRISGPLMNLSLPYLPGLFSFSVVIGIENENEGNTNHIFRLEMTREDGVQVLNTGSMPIQVPQSDRDDKTNSELLVNVDFKNIEFEQEGNYKLTLFIDELSIKTEHLKVLERKRR